MELILKIGVWYNETKLMETDEMKKTFIFVMALLVLSACAKPRIDIEGEWKLVSYGNPSNPMSAILDVDTTVNFDSKGKVGGTLGCNSFGGDYHLKGNNINFGPMISTMMFCELTSVQEQNVLSLLSDGIDLKIEINGNLLTIASGDGLSVVNLERK